ncbi:unnamed protein product [Brugia timori]|uniref:NADH dehydrogenase subunit 4 n=1 Tax=Brugia timori TaxID=42155 RepID=A0A0R3R9E7_9BILA|nr:unnamed protein product [Brugia timori]
MILYVFYRPLMFLLSMILIYPHLFDFLYVEIMMKLILP